jgi:hypothetical protein
MPVDGASISTISDFLDTETVSASDAIATHIDDVQFSLGEGPCWDALRSETPVLESDLRGQPPSRWPAFLDAISSDDIGAIFAFPLVLGTLKLGAMDLYLRDPAALDPLAIRHGEAIADAVSRLVLARALQAASVPYTSDDSPFSRRIIHQAVGVVLSQLAISSTDAMLVIQGHAFASNRALKDVAKDIVERRMSFASASGNIEGSDD